MNQKKKPRNFGASRGANIVVSECTNLYLKQSKKASEKSGKTHCVKDHPWTDKSSYVHNHGRNCRPCNAAAARRYRRRVKYGAVPE